MILAEQVYRIVRNALVTANITAYSDHIPDETTYPFVMYEIVNMDEDPDWAFEKDYELLKVRFNVYDNADNPSLGISIAEEIETIFNRTKKVFVDTSDGKHEICNYKVDDSITIENDPTRWLAISDYEFRAQRNIPGA